jgi:hypothetical protein
VEAGVAGAERAALAVCLSRTAERDRQPLADPQVVERLWHGFADLGQLEGHAVDLDTEDPSQAADLLPARLRDGSLAA